MGWNHQPEIDVKHDIVDRRNPAITTWDEKNPVNDGMNYQPQLVKAGFLNHQQHFIYSPSNILAPGNGWLEDQFAFRMAYFEGYISFRESIPPTWYTSARGNKHQQGHQDFQVPKMEVLNSYICDYLGCAFKYVLFSPRTSGKISILTNIFTMGWIHQLVNINEGFARLSLWRESWRCWFSKNVTRWKMWKLHSARVF